MSAARPFGQRRVMIKVGRRTRWGVWPAALALVASLLTVLPATPAEAKWNPPQPQEVRGVRVVDKKVDPAKPRWTADAHASRTPATVTWPAPSTYTVDLAAPAGQSAAGQPAAGNVRVNRTISETAGASALARSAQPGRVAVRVYDRTATVKAGVSGVLLSLTPDSGRTESVGVQVDYAGFAQAYGGDYASRLRLFRLPACAAATPERSECQGRTPVQTRNDLKAQSLTGEMTLAAAGPTIVSAEAASEGDNGDYKATSLSPAGTWQVSNQTGDFSWSYPLRMPPALGGTAPSISLSYSSGGVDGRTSTTNNQGSWIGDGWDSWPGYIERTYNSCTDDNLAHKTGDQCWFTDNATLSLNGHAGELIQSGSTWRLKSDDGTRIERLTDAARGNGDNDNEYWKVTTTDGTQYFFGYHKLPGWTAGNPVTDSTWTVPVYGDDSGEPCYNAVIASAYCSQAWRWNLDYIVEPHGNTEAYFYGKETGAYGRDNTPSQRTTYDRGGYLDHIDFGMRAGSEYAQAAPLRVVFKTDERCLTGCWTGTAWTSDPNPAAWKDTPWDQYCKAAPCTAQSSPTFWTARRLTKVTTQIRNGPATYSDVESWAFRQEFLDAGSGEGIPMWLRGITHSGTVTTAGGVVVSDPEITFDPGAEPLPNRVDGAAVSRSALNRWRIKTVTTETGGQIQVVYSPATDCSRTSLPNPETNTTRCMPSYYDAGGTPVLDWFHKYVVLRVDLDDIATDQPTQSVFYDYLDGAAWHYNTDEITKDKFRTWGQWRGYGRVQVRKGDPDGRQSAVETRYLRGMDGDKSPSSPGGVRDVQVAGTWGGSVEDIEPLQGFVLQETTFNGVGGAEVSSTVNTPWIHGPTATRTHDGVTTQSFLVKPSTSRTRTALESGGFRTTKTMSAYTDEGFETADDDFGDEAVTGDETCVRTTYARNDAIGMIDRVAQTETLSGTCAAAATPAVPATVLSRQRNFYDTYTGDSSFGAPPTAGDIVRVEDLDQFTGSTPVYVATAQSRYDANGRPIEATDARGYRTTTEFTTANGGLVTQSVVTNALGHKVTTFKEPAWDAPVKILGANNETTELTYDGLGRTTAVWLPGRSRAQSPNTRFTYLVRSATNQPTAVTTETLLPTGSAYKKAVSIYTGWLQQRQTQTTATGGGRILTDTFYDRDGNTGWTSEAYWDTTNAAPSASLGTPLGAIPGVTQHVYDGAGRETATVFVADGIEKWRSTTTYGGDRTHVAPPRGGTATTSITDVHDKVVELRQYKNPADLRSTDPATFDATHYTYDLAGGLSAVEDPAHNVWSYTYDLHGRQISATDPDKGVTTSTFDASNNIQSTTDALHNTLWYTYDELDRKISVRDSSATGPKRAEWTYDSVANGKGKAASTTRWIGTSAYTSKVDAYDAYGRPTSTSVVLPSSEATLCAAGGATPCTYTTTTSYKSDGSIYQTTLPAAGDLASEKLTFGYNDIGEQTTLQSAAQIYVYSATYDKIGQLTQRQLGAFGSRIAVTSTFDEPTRRPTGMSVVPEVGAEAARYAYTYDDAGNITKVSDSPAGQAADNQCFAFDYLRRLTSAWTPASGNCQTAPSVAGLQAGTASYWQDFGYDPTGNRLSEVDHASAGDTTYTYTVPASGHTAVRPHTVTSVRMLAPDGSTWTHGYTYDDAGNTATRLSDGGNQQQLTWDAEQHLSQVQEAGKTTSYVYDTDGNRMIRTDGDGTKTLYLPFGTEVKVPAGTFTALGTRYYSHKDSQVAMRTAAGGVTWLTPDHHGTTELSVKASDLSVTRRRTLPFGVERSTTGTWPAALDKGFVGGTKDATGLTHLGAREYDPAIGRFLSVDPEIDSNDPQQMNAYAYANNNPVTMSDPDGRVWGWLKKAGSAVASAASAATGAVVGAVASTVQSIKENPLKFAAELAVGVVAASFCGATAGLGCLVIAGAIAGAVTAGAEYTGEHVAKGDFSWGGLGESMLVGGAAGAAGAVLGVGAQKLLGPAVRVATNGAKRAFGRGAEDALEDGAEAVARRGAGASCRLSFDPSTPVLLAGGAVVAIGQIQLGDRVLATDPATGVTFAEPVVSLYSNRDLDMADVTVRDTDGHQQVLHTTQKHPFWDAGDHTWTPAGQLQPGDRLLTPSGATAEVVAVLAWTEANVMLNIGVDTIHTYYVLAGRTPVLVHNRPAPALGDVGTYGGLGSNEGLYFEKNHIPPHSTKPKGSSYSKGGAIRMDKADHRALLSSKSTLAGIRQRMMQRDLIKAGYWEEALELEYDDMRNVAARRGAAGIYDDAIAQHKALFGRPPCP